MTLIAPTEPPALRAIGTTSLAPESYGADIMWVGHGGVLVGVQRKALDDLLTSAEDGRLGQQVTQMQALDLAFLCVEGKLRWAGEGGAVFARGGRARQWSIGAVRGLLWSCMARGVHVDWTRDLDDTIGWCEGLRAWTLKDKHQSLLKRAPVGRDALGRVGMREMQLFLHMGLPGVGPELAGRLVDAGGVFGLSMTKQEMMGVEGVGEGRAEKIAKVLGDGRGEDDG